LDSIQEPTSPGGGTLVALDTPCCSCGYNLRGLNSDGLCPECATPIQSSLRRFRLRFADPQYLAALCNGLDLLRWCVVTMLIGFAIFAVITIGDFPVTVWHPIQQYVSRFSAICYLLEVWGGWRLSTANPSGLGASEHANLRNLIRVGVIAGLLRFMLGLGVYRYLPLELRFLIRYLSPMLVALEDAGEVGIVGYLIYLARDIPNHRLALHAKCLMWCFGIVCLADYAGNAVNAVAPHHIFHTPLDQAFISFMEAAGWATAVVFVWALIFLQLFLRAVRTEKEADGHP
jgi:hypothetical protein